MTNRYTSFERLGTYTVGSFTALTAARHDIDVITEELTPERNNIYPVTSKGRTPRRKLPGPLGWTGNIETLFYTLHAPTLLYYAMGGIKAIVLDTPTVGTNTHTIIPASTIPHFQLETGRDLVGHQYTGCVATGFNLEYAPDTAVTLNVDVNARAEWATGTLDTVTFADYDSAERAYGGVEVATNIGLAEAATSPFGTVESFSLTYDNNFEDSAYVLGSQYLSGNFVNQINCTGSMELSYLTNNDYQDVVGDVEKHLELVTSNGLTLTAARGYTVDMPRISYDSTSLPTNNAERYVQSLEFTCNDNAAGNALEIAVHNTQLQAPFIA